MTRERRLGRGLEALLGKVGPAQPEAPAPAPAGPRPDAIPAASIEPLYGGSIDDAYRPTIVPAPGVQDETPKPQPPLPEVPPVAPGPSGPSNVAIGLIDSNPYQPRRDFDTGQIDSLSESLREHGLLQPVVVRKVDDRYQLIAGERRLRAAARAGWTEVPTRLVEADDRTTAELAIVENLQRKDLNPLEKAASFQRYLETYGSTQEELASRLKLDRSTIANLIRLLELPQPVQDAIRQGKITQGHGRALLPLGEEREQVEFCRRIQREGLSVRKTESLVQEAIATADAEPLSLLGRDGNRLARGGTSDHLAALEQELRAALGTKIAIRHGARGRGKIVIHFTGHDEFERLRRHLCGPAQPEIRSRVG